MCFLGYRFLCSDLLYSIPITHHTSLLLDFCDASYNCHQECPSGYDAECPSGMRCFAKTPCNANVQSTSSNFLRFGLPENVMTLFRNYQLEGGEGAGAAGGGEGQTTNAAAEPTGGGGSVLVGIFFAISAIIFVGLNVLSKNSGTSN